MHLLGQLGFFLLVCLVLPATITELSNHLVSITYLRNVQCHPRVTKFLVNTDVSDSLTFHLVNCCPLNLSVVSLNL